MDAFLRVEEALSKESRSKEDALELLKTGIKEGTLLDVAVVIAGSCGVDPVDVAAWYAKYLEDQVKLFTEIRHELNIFFDVPKVAG